MTQNADATEVATSADDVAVAVRLGPPVVTAVDKEIERLKTLGFKSSRSDVIRRALAKYFGWAA